MNRPRRQAGTGGWVPIAAGSTIVASIILCAAIGFGLGALVGLAVPLGIVGLFAGVVAGIALVITRFRDL